MGTVISMYTAMPVTQIAGYHVQKVAERVSLELIMCC